MQGKEEMESERAMLLGGANALPAEASQIIQLNWLDPKNKKDQRIMVSTEGR